MSDEDKHKARIFLHRGNTPQARVFMSKTGMWTPPSDAWNG